MSGELRVPELRLGPPEGGSHLLVPPSPTAPRRRHSWIGGISSESNDWDVLVFTQHWPLTVCFKWRQQRSNNLCRLPDDENTWTIHGLWPTKFGTMGPSYCNDTWKFYESVITPIESDLNKFWTNIHMNKPVSFLWEHEWEKHGTCATILPQLNDQLKYFKQGLELIKLYNMKNILSKYHIIPGSNSYNVENIFNSIKNDLNHNPVVRCVVDRSSNQALISEVQICFDKNFSVIDCDPVKHNFKNGGILTDCNLANKVFYPNKL